MLWTYYLATIMQLSCNHYATIMQLSRNPSIGRVLQAWRSCVASGAGRKVVGAWERGERFALGLRGRAGRGGPRRSHCRMVTWIRFYLLGQRARRLFRINS